jgi:hypothetical protein
VADGNVTPPTGFRAAFPDDACRCGYRRNAHLAGEFCPEGRNTTFQLHATPDRAATRRAIGSYPVDATVPEQIKALKGCIEDAACELAENGVEMPQIDAVFEQARGYAEQVWEEMEPDE